MKTLTPILAFGLAMLLLAGAGRASEGGPPAPPAIGAEAVPEAERVAEAPARRAGTAAAGRPIRLRATGHLALEFPGACTFTPGDLVTVWLTVSSLDGPVNGVQALIEFDPNVVQVDDVLPGDGAGSPWDAAVVVAEDVGETTLTYAAGLLSGTDQAGAVVARLRFVFLAGAAPPAGQVVLLAAHGALETLLTDAGTGAAFAPTLGEAVAIVRFADADADGDIDGADWLLLDACVAGPDVAHGGAPCCRFDDEPDDDVDLADVAAVQRAFGGTGK